MSSKFSSTSEEKASEVLENLEEYFLGTMCYLHIQSHTGVSNVGLSKETSFTIINHLP